MNSAATTFNHFSFSKLHIDFIPRTINVLAGLLRDTSPQVIKRVIQACAAVYKNTLLWLVTLADISDATESSWNTLCHMKVGVERVLSLTNETTDFLWLQFFLGGNCGYDRP